MTIRFLEESPGVWSMTRLLALMAAVGGALAMVTACMVAITATVLDAERMSHASGLVAALSALAAAAFGGSWAQTRERAAGEVGQQQAEPTPAMPVKVTMEAGG